MIQRYFALITMTIVLSAATVAANAARGSIKCWTNSDGVRECGNSVPPQYAQQGTEEKSSQGITVNRKERAKTQEEIAAERAERERIASEEAERERLANLQAHRDHVLIATFTTEEDLMLTRDGKLAAIESRIKHVQQVGKKIEQSMAELHAEAARLERAGKPVPPELQGQITAAQAQLRENRDEVNARRNERVVMEKQFQMDLARYRELKGMN